jgi:predicted Zn-dependent peptidase
MRHSLADVLCRRPSLAAGAALAIIAAPAWAQQPVSRQLPNGLELVVTPASDRSLVVVTRYFAGSRDDPESRRGLAHLVEHLAMRETRGGPSLAVLIARNGWSGGAATGDSVTSFEVSTPAGDSAALTAMLGLERLRMTSLAIDSAALRVESRRIAAEVGGSDARVAAHRDLDRITATDAQAWYRRFYLPGNALITIQSSLPPAEVLRIAERELALVPAAPVPDSAARNNARAAAVRVAIRSADRAGGGVSASGWLPPDTLDLRWLSAGPLRWAAASGGRPDTVFFAVWVAAPPALAAPEIAALELLARTFGALRLPDGQTLETGIKTLGGSLTASSLPYPPLATADRFRMLATPDTPVGLAGLQLVGAAPRGAAPDVLRLLATALARGRTDSAAVVAEVQTQVGLLSQANEAGPNPEVTFRRSLPVLPPEPAAAWRPAELPEQRRTMERLSWRDVEQAAATLVEAGSVRIALLGVEPDLAAGWLTEWVWPSRDAPSPVAASPGCPRPEGGTVSAGPAAARASVYFALCIPEGTPVGVSAPLQVASAILGAREDAVLAARLRGATGLAYDFANRLVPTPGGGPTLWYLRVGTRGATVQQAIREVHDLLATVARDGVAEAVVAEYREWLAARWLRRGVEGTGWVTALVTNGASPEQEAARVRAVPVEAVKAVWRYWSPAGLRVTAPGDTARIRP